MSMYGVNAGVPKTLVRHMVQYEADIAKSKVLREVLLDILDTPVSPELLPAKDGEISQQTEALVGPYELHDFYLYQVLRFGFGPAKIFRLAKAAFAGRPEYPDSVLYKWLRNFYWRFFAVAVDQLGSQFSAGGVVAAHSQQHRCDGQHHRSKQDIGQKLFVLHGLPEDQTATCLPARAVLTIVPVG